MKYVQLIQYTFFCALLSLSGHLFSATAGKKYSYYEILGVAQKDATDDTIKQAFNREILALHADKWQKMVDLPKRLLDSFDESFDQIKGASERKKYNETPAFRKCSADTAAIARRAQYLKVAREVDKEILEAYKKIVVTWDIAAWSRVVYGERSDDGTILSVGALGKLSEASQDCGPIKPSHYEWFGVLPSASDAEIKAAYQKLLVQEQSAEWKKYLTLVQERLKAIEEMTRVLIEARKGLRNSNQRAMYNLQPLLVSTKLTPPIQTKAGNKKSSRTNPQHKGSSGSAGSAPGASAGTSKSSPGAGGLGTSSAKGTDTSQGRRTGRYIGNKTLLAAAVTLTGITAWYYYRHYYNDADQEIPVRHVARPVRTAVDHTFEKKAAWASVVDLGRAYS